MNFYQDFELMFICEWNFKVVEFSFWLIDFSNFMKNLKKINLRMVDLMISEAYKFFL